MKGFGGFLLLASLAFAVFSGFYGVECDHVRHAGGFGRSDSTADSRLELEQLHSIVAPVSIGYYLFYLGFFVRGLRRSPWRKLCVFGIVATIIMTVWSANLDAAISFDEVYPAWIAAAAVLAGLQIVVSGPSRRRGQQPDAAAA